MVSVVEMKVDISCITPLEGHTGLKLLRKIIFANGLQKEINSAFLLDIKDPHRAKFSMANSTRVHLSLHFTKMLLTVGPRPMEI